MDWLSCRCLVNLIRLAINNQLYRTVTDKGNATFIKAYIKTVKYCTFSTKPTNYICRHNLNITVMFNSTKFYCYNLYLDSNFFLRFHKMGCSRKYPYPPWRKLTTPPSLLWTSCPNSRHSLYDSPLPPWTVEISSVGEVWFFFGRTSAVTVTVFC